MRKTPSARMSFSRLKQSSVSLFAGSAFLSAVLFAIPSAAQSINATAIEKRYDTANYWTGETPCDRLFETPVAQLPGGAPLTQILGEEAVQGRYTLPSGGTLSVTIRQPQKIPVNGTQYSEAISDLYTRRPFQDSIDRKTSLSVVLADVKILRGMRAGKYELEDGSGFALKPESLGPKLTAKVRVADWQEYVFASASDQQNWDAHLCESYHHELGHILVAAQVLEESESEWLALRGDTKDALDLEMRALMKDIGARIRTRQQAYHDEIKAMGPVLSQSRPYLELPFSWLKQDVIDLAEP